MIEHAHRLDEAHEEAHAPLPPRRPAPGKVSRTQQLPGLPHAASTTPAAGVAPIEPSSLLDPFGGALEPAAARPRHQPADVAAARAVLDRAFAAHRTALVTSAGEQAPLVQQAAAAEYGQALASIGQRETSARGHFAQARAHIRDAERTQVAAAAADAAAVAARLRQAKVVRAAYLDAAAAEAQRADSAGQLAAAMIDGSAAMLIAMFDARGGQAMDASPVDVRPEEGETFNEQRAALRSETRVWIARERYQVRAAGVESARALRGHAAAVVAQVTPPLLAAADEIERAGARVAAAIAHDANTRIEALAAAEQQVLGQIAGLRLQAAGILHAAPAAASQARSRVSADLDALTARHITVNLALDRAGRGGQDALDAARDHQLALLDGEAGAARARTRGTAATFTAVVSERRARAFASVDASLGALATELDGAVTSFAADSNLQRTLAIQDYAAGETQLTTAALAQLAPVHAAWKTEADRFIGEVTKAAAAVVTQHTEVTTHLEASFASLLRQVVKHARRDGKARIRDSMRRTGRGMIHGFKNTGVGLLKVVAINMAGFALGGLGIIAAGAYGAYGLVQGVDHRIRTLDATWESRSTFRKVTGILETSTVLITDQLGVTAILEGLTQHEAITQRRLSTEEVGAKSAEGLTSVAVLAALAALHARITDPTTPRQLTAGSPPPPPPKLLAAGPPVAEPVAAHPPLAEPAAAHPPVAGPPSAHPPVAEPPARPPIVEPPARPPVTEPPANPPVAEPPANPPVAEPALPRPADPPFEPAAGDTQPSTRPDAAAEVEPPNVSTRPAQRAPSTEELLHELSKDPDHNGKVTASSTRAAVVATELGKANRLTLPIRRPRRGDGHSGDFVDGAGRDWDMKAPRSRSTLIEGAKAKAVAAGRKAPEVDPDRPIRGEFEVNAMIADIKGELAGGERVIIDTAGLVPEDVAALKKAVNDAGLTPEQVIFFP